MQLIIIRMYLHIISFEQKKKKNKQTDGATKRLPWEEFERRTQKQNRLKTTNR